MHRIGIITPDSEQDWASAELLRVANNLAEGIQVDPMSFRMCVDGTASMLIQGRPAEWFDAFIVRGFNRMGEIDYQFEVFELLEQSGRLVINSTAGLSLAESKAQTTYHLRMAGLPVPRTLVTQSLNDAVCAVRELGTAVVKPLYGSFGIGIEKLSSDTADQMLPMLLDSYGALYIQEYIPNDGRDIRAFIVGDEVSAAMYRIAADGQWKTNVFQGSSCEECELSAQLRELCLEAVRIIGLDYTGVDLIEGPDGPVILELNGAPMWYGLLEATGTNVAENLMKHALHMLDTGQPARRPMELQSVQFQTSDPTVNQEQDSVPILGQ